MAKIKMTLSYDYVKQWNTLMKYIQMHLKMVILDIYTVNRIKTSPDSSSNPIHGMNDFERQLQEFFVEVKTMLKIGNKDGAIDLLQANYESVKEQMDAGAKGMEQAAILDIIALGYMCLGDFELVEGLLDMVFLLFKCYTVTLC